MARVGVDPSSEEFRAAIRVLEHPWTGTLLALLQGGAKRFGELAAGAGGVADKILSARLKELEAQGLVSRVVDTGPPLRGLYALTPRADGFGLVAEAIARWGQELLGAGGTLPRGRRQ